MERPMTSNPKDLGPEQEMLPPNSFILKGRYRRDHPPGYETTLNFANEAGLEGEKTGEVSARMPERPSSEARVVSPPPRRRRALVLRDLFSDTVIAIGASLMLFSIALVVFVFVATLPASNPYIGILLFVLLPVVALVGLLLFVFGVVLGRERRSPRDPQHGRHVEDGPP